MFVYPWMLEVPENTLTNDQKKNIINTPMNNENARTKRK